MQAYLDDKFTVPLRAEISSVRICIGKRLYGVKRAHSPQGIPNRHKECNGLQRHDNTSSYVAVIT